VQRRKHLDFSRDDDVSRHQQALDAVLGRLLDRL
jgi:hypothetical protein